MDEIVTRPEVIRSRNSGSGDVFLRFDLSKLREEQELGHPEFSLKTGAGRG